MEENLFDFHNPFVHYAGWPALKGNHGWGDDLCAGCLNWIIMFLHIRSYHGEGCPF